MPCQGKGIIGAMKYAVYFLAGDAAKHKARVVPDSDRCPEVCFIAVYKKPH